MTPVPSAPFDEARARRLIQASLLRGTAIDKLINEALYPDGAPHYWGQWDENARYWWDHTVRLYGEARGFSQTDNQSDRLKEAHRDRQMVSVAEAWAAVDESARAEDPVDRLAWADITKRLQVRNRRRCQYLLDTRLGFTMNGRPGEKELIAAPCILCEEVYPAMALNKSHHCVDCIEVQQLELMKEALEQMNVPLRKAG